MRLAAVVAALGLALLAGTAHASTFTVLPASLPSSETPNARGALVLPTAWTEHAARPQQLPLGGLAPLWREAGTAYGIPWQVLAAINEIESNFGQNVGPSSAGAVGWMQFMLETWLRWGMDGNADGVADPWNAEDAIYAASRYLAAAGGRVDIRRAVFAYNHADWYVEQVLALAARYGEGGLRSLAGATSVAPQPNPALVEARKALGRANEELVEVEERLARAVRNDRGLTRLERRLGGFATSSRLLSKRLALEKRAARLADPRARAAGRVEELRRAVVERRIAVAEAEEAIEAAVTATPTALVPPAVLPGAAPEGYVFPVGGGPSLVSVGSDHHDYPAADIAAPMGSPVYALSDATVAAAWPGGNGACGIGLTLEAADGQTWTYCHLSYLDPGVRSGSVLAAGAQLGLVGSTGRSTGPHLHLQLVPTSSYPQDQPWFRSFAGTAFRWQDGGPSRALGSGPSRGGRVFAIVGEEPATTGGDVVAFTQ